MLGERLLDQAIVDGIGDGLHLFQRQMSKDANSRKGHQFSRLVRDKEAEASEHNQT